MIQFSLLARLILVFGLLQITIANKINAECPLYFEDLADESQVIERLRGDI